MTTTRRATEIWLIGNLNLMLIPASCRAMVMSCISVSRGWGQGGLWQGHHSATARFQCIRVFLAPKEIVPLQWSTRKDIVENQHATDLI